MSRLSDRQEIDLHDQIMDTSPTPDISKNVGGLIQLLLWEANVGNPMILAGFPTSATSPRI